jgi:hypothetical protein
VMFMEPVCKSTLFSWCLAFKPLKTTCYDCKHDLFVCNNLKNIRRMSNSYQDSLKILHSTVALRSDYATVQICCLRRYSSGSFQCDSNEQRRQHGQPRCHTMF